MYITGYIIIILPRITRITAANPWLFVYLCQYISIVFGDVPFHAYIQHFKIRYATHVPTSQTFPFVISYQQ